MTAVAPLAAATTPGDFVAASAAFAQHTCDPGSGTAPLAVRLELHRLGLPPLALSWLARDDGEDVAEASYRLLFACTAQVNRDDDAEIQTCVMTASHAQLFALGEKEVTRRPPRAKAVVKLLEVLQALSLVRESADVVASSSAMAASLSALLRDEDRSPVGQNALNVLKNLALFPSAHAALLRADVMKNCLGLIGMLSSQKEDELLTALRAASLVCRLHGSDESGPGSDVIQGNNHAVIAKMMWVLDEVVRAGPSQRVLGSSWDPANILSDLVALAKSDRNKPLLAPSVSLVVAALDKRASNKRLVARSITLLALLLWEPTQCQPAFHAQRKPLAQVLGSVDALALPIVSRRELASLKEWLATGASPSSAPPLAPRRPSLLARISSQGGARKHVFISYCWDDSVPVLACHTLLKEREFPLWLDRENMGENLIDSMVDGLQRAAVVVAFMSPSYKGSATCRREMELAIKLTVPVVFVNLAPAYSPDGWLGFLLGHARWVDAADPDRLDAWAAEIAQRALDAFTSKPAVKEPKPSTTPARIADTAAMLRDVLAALGDVRNELAAVKEEARAAREEERRWREAVLMRLGPA